MWARHDANNTDELVSQETMNYWRQATHIMSYFKEENFRGDKRLPKNFITGFLDVSLALTHDLIFTEQPAESVTGSQLDCEADMLRLHVHNESNTFTATPFALLFL